MLRPVVLVALLLSPSLAWAQPRAGNLGEQHYQAGVDAYARRQFHAATIEFRAAYELTSEPMLLFNLGNALAADGQQDAARDAYERYLRAVPTASNRVDVEARLRDLAPVRARPVVAPVVPVPRVEPRVLPVAPVESPRRSPLVYVGAIAGGAGLVAAAVGAALYVDTGAAYSQCQQRACTRDQEPRGEDAAAVGLLWGGGALAVAGLVTFLVAPRAAPAAPRVTYLFARPGLVGVGGTF